MEVGRGDIWWVDFGVPFGSKPGYRRPAVVMQANAFNRSRVQTVIVIPMSKTIGLASAPGNVLCRPRETGLRKPSVANVSQIAVIDRRRLVEKVNVLPGRVLRQVEDGARLVLGL